MLSDNYNGTPDLEEQRTDQEGLETSQSNETSVTDEQSTETVQQTQTDTPSELQMKYDRLLAAHTTLQQKYNAEVRNWKGDMAQREKRISELESMLSTVKQPETQHAEDSIESLAREYGFTQQEMEAMGYENISAQRKMLNAVLSKLQPVKEEPKKQETQPNLSPQERMFYEVMESMRNDWVQIDRDPDFKRYLESDPIKLTAYINSPKDGRPEVALTIMDDFLMQKGTSQKQTETVTQNSANVHVTPKTLPAKSSNEKEIISRAEFDRIKDQFLNAGSAVPPHLAKRYKECRLALAEGRVE